MNMVDEPAPASGTMEGGGAYNRHARFQAAGAFYALPHLETAARKVSLDDDDHPLVIADYGSSEGKNSLDPMRIAIKILRSRAGPVRPIIVYHTDLPANDFRSLFDVVENDPDRYSRNDPSVFPCGIGRSFYNSILPPEHVHLGWSSYAANWLSEVPPLPPGHILHSRMTAAARDAFECQAARDWESFLALRSSELRPGGRLVVTFPSTRDDGSSGFEPIMDHAYHVLTEMVAEGAITANQRDRMALGVVVRHRRDLLAPFQNSESYRGLKVEYCQTSEHADPAWGDYERDGNLAALVNKHAGFFRATFAPTLAAPLKHHDDADARRRFSDRLEHGLRQRLTAAPEPINSLVETIVLVKTSRRLSS